MDQNLAVYNQYTFEYQDYSLYPPERVILQKFKARWPQMRMLDIGIGTGRSTHTFGAIAGKYVGIDYAEEMVKATRRVVPESEDVALHHCDARDLSKYYDQRFDFAMFSLNGLDSVSHEDRRRILQEVRKVLTPDGYFFFSTHSVRAFSRTRPLPPFKLSKPQSLYHFSKAVLFNSRLKRTHRNMLEEEVRQRDWAILKTGDHDFKIDIYHINPLYQIQELTKLGFRIDTILDTNGQKADPASTTAEWLYFLCQPEQTSAAS